MACDRGFRPHPNPLPQEREYVGWSTDIPFTLLKSRCGGSLSKGLCRVNRLTPSAHQNHVNPIITRILVQTIPLDATPLIHYPPSKNISASANSPFPIRNVPIPIHQRQHQRRT